MSSTYRILCLSHDPATEAGEYSTPEAAEHAIAQGLPEHPNCDLAIGRYSYPLVELGCPTSKTNRAAKLRCCHSATIWTDSGWLRLLAAAYQSTDPDLLQAAADARQSCLPWPRLRLLRQELGFTVKEEHRG